MKGDKLTVISETGEKLGNFIKRDAIELARERGLDILQITFDKEPFVAKIIDYGKFWDTKANVENQKGWSVAARGNY